MGPGEMDRVYRAAMTRRAKIGRGVIIVLLLALFACMALAIVLA
jgi:hypothetical protein